MGFRINTNIAGMNTHQAATMNNRELDISLSRLSSGLRINTAADDASGMVIADSLNSQHSALGQAIKNANDAIGMVQTADKAMDEQIKILSTIKTKATQAAADGQNKASRSAIQNDIEKLLQELDNIAQSTSFNGMSLLSGSFTDKEFQIGADSRQTIGVTIGDTSSGRIGSVQYETLYLSDLSSANSFGSTTMSFANNDGSTTTINAITLSTGAGTGVGALAEAINRASSQTGIRAKFSNVLIASSAVKEGSVQGLTINNIKIGDIDLKKNDENGALRNAINAVSALTGVAASVDESGRLQLQSDGRGMRISATNSTLANAIAKSSTYYQNTSTDLIEGYGAVTLISNNSYDIKANWKDGQGNNNNVVSTSTFIWLSQRQNLNLRSTLKDMGGDIAFATGAVGDIDRAKEIVSSGVFGVGVTTRHGAMLVMDIAESAMKQLGKIRADLGSVQNQLTTTINNITVTQVNVAAAESQIRDVDFAHESSNFSKRNILAQSGSYAMVQANSIQQSVLRLLG